METHLQYRFNQDKECLDVTLKKAIGAFMSKDYRMAMVFFKVAKSFMYDNTPLVEHVLKDIDLDAIDYALLKSSREKYFQKHEELLKGAEKRKEVHPLISYERALLFFQQQRFHEAEFTINDTLNSIAEMKDENDWKAYWPWSDVEIPECNKAVLIDRLHLLKHQCRAITFNRSKDKDTFSDNGSYHSDSSSEKEITGFGINPNAPEFVPSNLSHTKTKKKDINKSTLFNVNAMQKTVDNLLMSQIHQCLLFQEKFERSTLEKEESIRKDIKSILSQLMENQQLQKTIKALETQVTTQRSYFFEEDRIRSFKLEYQIEDLKKALTERENVIKKQEQKIKLLETFLTEQLSNFRSLQKQEAVRQVNKCISMIKDLNLVKPYLTSISAPKVEECHISISRWEEQLKNVKQYSDDLDSYFHSIFRHIHNDDYPLQLDQPKLYTDISELRDILHDNYVLYFIRLHSQTFHNPPAPVPNPGIWFGNCLQQSGQVMHRPFSYNQIEGPSILNYPGVQNIKTSQPPILLKAPICSNLPIENISKTTTFENKAPDFETDKIVEMLPESETDTADKDVAESDNVVSTEPSVDSTHLKQEDLSEKAVPDSPSSESVKVNVTNLTTVTSTSPATPSCSYSDKESDLVNLNELVKNKDTQVSDAAKAIGGPKFSNLFWYVKKKIPNCKEEIVLSALKNVRQKKVKLSGMTRDDIVNAVLQELKNKCEDTESASSSKPAWANLKTDHATWHKDVSDNICIICYDPYDTATVVELKCQHSFHAVCIKKWFTTTSVCPICRLHTTTDEDFPPLV